MEGEVLNEYTDHVNEQFQIRSRFSFNNSYIFSGSEDNHLYVYNILKVSFFLFFLLKKRKKLRAKLEDSMMLFHVLIIVPRRIALPLRVMMVHLKFMTNIPINIEKI
jgi:hypothetical protein